MIVSNLQNSSRIEPLHPLFKQLFDYVKNHDLLPKPAQLLSRMWDLRC